MQFAMCAVHLAFQAGIDRALLLHAALALVLGAGALPTRKRQTDQGLGHLGQPRPFHGALKGAMDSLIKIP